MYFESLSDFIAMGGHAKYVWSSYLIALFIFILNLVLPVMARQRFFNNQSRRLRRETSARNVKIENEGHDASGS
jgi:heme exporter protein D